jgi:hypothetical protein
MPDHDRLPDEALVVRGGRPPFVRPLEDDCDPHPDGYYGFSVQCAAGATLDELGSGLRNKHLGVTTVAAIRELGYDVM